MRDWTSILGSGMLVLSACGLTVALTYRLYLHIRLRRAQRKARQAFMDVLQEMAEVHKQYGMDAVVDTMTQAGFTHEVYKDGTATVHVFRYASNVIKFYDN